MKTFLKAASLSTCLVALVATAQVDGFPNLVSDRSTKIGGQPFADNGGTAAMAAVMAAMAATAAMAAAMAAVMAAAMAVMAAAMAALETEFWPAFLPTIVGRGRLDHKQRIQGRQLNGEVP